MLPTSLSPLWGVVAGATPAEPVRFVSRRELPPDGRRRFTDMLLGREP